MYLANPSSARIRAVMAAGQLGMMVTPAQGNRLPPGVAFSVDNGCGPGRDGKPGTGYPGDRAYLELLARMSARARLRCLFATAPDVLCDAPATIERSARFVYRIRASFGLPVALVAQDGAENLDMPWSWFDVLFIGGSDTWKEGPAARSLAAEAKARGKGVHMGRVNTFRRLRYAERIGCDTADGTYLAFGPNANLPSLLSWLRAVNDQRPLWADMTGAA
jgi:hypothetical protein